MKHTQLVKFLIAFFSIAILMSIFCPVEASAYGGNRKRVSKNVFYKRMKEANNSVMELKYDRSVRRYVRNYISRSRYGTEVILGRKAIYFPIIEKYIEEMGLPDALKNVPIIESALDPKARSKVGAKGLWQFMPRTGRAYGLTINKYVDERCDPVKSTIAGLTYLKDLHKIYKDWKLVLAAYNCGPGNVDKAIRKARSRDFDKIKRFLPKETQEYIPRFMAAWYTTDNYLLHDLRPNYPEYTMQFCKVVKIYKKKSLKEIATETGMDLKTIQKLNPSYRRGIVPTNIEGNFVIIPIFGEELSSINEE